MIPKTVKRCLADGILQLDKACIAGAAVDARILLAHCIGVERGRLTLHLEDAITKVQRQRFFIFIDQRCASVPVSKIIRARTFFGRDFYVNAHVLDPRPDTEALILTALEEPFDEVLDLGTGSGAIIATLLAERADATGIATDVSDQALAVAQRNAEALGVSDRVWFEQSDWFQAVGGTYDLIVSNPPYIAASEMDGLQPEVRTYEPRIALTDEADGLTCYRKIIAAHDPHLNAGGRLMVEIGPTQAAAVTAMMQTANLTEITVIPDLDGRDRVVWGRKPPKTA